LPEQVVLQVAGHTMALLPVVGIVGKGGGGAAGLAGIDIVPFRFNARFVVHELFQGIFPFGIQLLLVLTLFVSVRQGFVAKIVSQLQQRIAFYCLLNFLAQVQRGQLQEANGLLQLRCHGQLLADL